MVDLRSSPKSGSRSKVGPIDRLRTVGLLTSLLDPDDAPDFMDDEDDFGSDHDEIAPDAETLKGFVLASLFSLG